MKSKVFLLVFLVSIAAFNSCKNNVIDEDNVICTDHIETIRITVSKFKLDKYHTIRLATGDTLPKINYSNVYDNKYPVIDDSYQQMLLGRVEKFRFQGFLKDSLVVNEDFEVAADVCHIFYKSGKLIVE